MYKLKNALMELEELGVQVSVKSYTPDKNRKKEEVREELAKPGGELVLEEDGCIAYGRQHKNFALIARMPKASFLSAFIVQGNKEIQLLSDLSEEDEKEAVHVKLVPTYDVWHGKSFSTKSHDNNIRVVSVKNGRFKKFEISIVTRIYQKETCYFLAVQRTYQAQLFNDVDTTVAVLDSEYPGYKDWPDLQNLVEEMIPYKDIHRLPLIEAAMIAVTDIQKNIQIETLGENQGKVIFFNPRLGYGKALTQKGPKHFSWQNVADDVRFQHFENGDLITFESIEENAKGGQLIGVKSTKKEVM